MRIRVVLCLVAMWSGIAAGAEGVRIEPGDQAPAFVAADPSGTAVNYPQVADGRPVVLLFWATWCPYCKALMPHLADLREKYRARGVQVLALNIKEDGDPVAYMRDTGYDFQLLLDADGVAESYGVRFTPGLFVVDGSGRVVFRRRPSGGKKPSEIVGSWAQQADAAIARVIAESSTGEERK